MARVGFVVQDLHKSFQGRTVLQGFSLTLSQRGRIAGIFGPNGTGKTTLFRCILGLEQCRAAEISWDGVDLRGLTTDQIARGGVSLMFQRPVAMDGLTVCEQLALLQEEAAGEANLPHIEDQLTRLGLLPIRNTQVSRLSFGEAKLVDFARVMLLEPRLLLLDEPFSGVDPLHIEVMQQQIRRAATPERLVILTDHNLHQALHFVDQVAILIDGRVMFEGTPQAARADPAVRSLYLGTRF